MMSFTWWFQPLTSQPLVGCGSMAAPSCWVMMQFTWRFWPLPLGQPAIAIFPVHEYSLDFPVSQMVLILQHPVQASPGGPTLYNLLRQDSDMEVPSTYCHLHNLLKHHFFFFFSMFCGVPMLCHNLVHQWCLALSLPLCCLLALIGNYHLDDGAHKCMEPPYHVAGMAVIDEKKRSGLSYDSYSSE